jgi:sulfur transfer protein SufE/stress-induced morphogen
MILHRRCCGGLLLFGALVAAALSLLLTSAADAYVVCLFNTRKQHQRHCLFALHAEPTGGGNNNSETLTSRTTLEKATSVGDSAKNSDDNNDNPLGLTPELLKITNAFEMIGDDKLRYKQLLFMANQAKPMDPASQIPENKVPGCLSTVYVDGTVERVVAKGSSSSDDDEDKPQYLVHFVGDSDGLLTKGLVSLLVRGLSGNTAAAIQKVDPAFVQKAGISTSLTPGRNNGFLNMIAVMKRKALELQALAVRMEHQQVKAADPASEGAPTDAESRRSMSENAGPMYNAIQTALLQLKPEHMELKDVSYQHAGHVESGNGTESHFELDIVADAFDGLSLVQRHKLIYMILGDVMPQIHALQIRAKTPAEV